jgi:hypothetical protein
VLTTDDFERLARFQARAMGFPDLRIVVVPHPLGGIPAEEALKKAPEAIEKIVAFFDA